MIKCPPYRRAFLWSRKEKHRKTQAVHSLNNDNLYGKLWWKEQKSEVFPCKCKAC